MHRATGIVAVSLSVFAILGLVANTASASLAVGTKAPALKVKATDGKTYTLSALKGKVVLLDFWATWCPPCRAEIPHIQDLYKKYGKQGLVVIGVSIGEGKKAPADYAAKNKLTYTIGYTETKEAAALGKTFDFNGIPATYIIDKKGVIKHAEIGYEDGAEKKFDETIKKLVKSK